jgi:hypothetical protein
MGVEAVEEPKFFIELSKFDRPLFTIVALRSIAKR